MSNELFQQRISCVVCEQPLPPKRGEHDQEPGYFPQGSLGYQAGWEPERNCEDIDQLLRYLQTLAETIWQQVDIVRLVEKARRDRVRLEMSDEPLDYLDRARDLCTLFAAIQAELARRFQQLSKSLDTRYCEQERALHLARSTPPSVTPETNQP